MTYRFMNALQDGSCFKSIVKTALRSPNAQNHDYHPHYELYYYKHGGAQTVILNNRAVRTDGPCVIFCPPFAIHGMLPADGNPFFERFVFYFDGAFMGSAEKLLPRAFFAASQACIFPLTPEQNERCSIFADELLNSKESAAEAASFFAAFVNYVYREVPPQKRIAHGAADPFIVNIIKYIYENKHERINADTISRVFHISRSKLDRDFKEYIGRSVHTVLSECRLNYATELLLTTDRKISDIALACGFDSEYYFYSFYKRATGKTPLQVRKSMSPDI